MGVILGSLDIAGLGVRSGGGVGEEWESGIC